MKKVLKILGVVLVVVLIAAVVVVGFQLGGIIKKAVETAGPKFTGGSVTLENAFVRPFAGKASLKGLVVGNPEGYKTPSAFELGEVAVQLDVKSLASDTIVIEEILIDGPEITFEKSLKKSNIAQILENVSAASPPAEEGEAPEEEPEAEPTEGGKKVVINHVLVKGAQVKLSTALLMGKSVVLPLPPIELNDIGKEKGGTSFPEAIGEILKAILGSVTKVVGAAGEMAVDGAKAVGGAALKGADMAGDAAMEAGEAAVDGAKAVGGAAVDGAAAVGGAAVDGAAVVGGAAADGAKAVGGAAADGAKAVGGAAADGAKAIGEGAGKLLKGVGGMFGGADKEVEEKE